MKYKSPRLLLLVSFAIRAILACITELNNDEVYYWTYARKLQWNYFDHPPGIAVLLRISTVNLLFQQEFFLRLGSICCAAISTWLIFLLGKKIKDDFAGTIAALLFTASPYCSIIAGVLVIPDAPQLVFWLASILLMLKIIDPHARRRKTRQRLLFLGLTIGCTILCKVHGLCLWIGFLSYIVLYQKRLLSNPFLFYAAFITVLVISPVFFWNLSNQFISYRYHSSRVGFFGTLHPEGLLRECLGEIIYNHPINIILLATTILALARRFVFVALPYQRLLLWISLPMIVMVWLMAVFRDTLPHWSGPAFTSLIPLTAAYLATRAMPLRPWKIPAAVNRAWLLTLILLVPAIYCIKALPYAIGSKEPVYLGKGDPTLDMCGFRDLGHVFDSLYTSDRSINLVKENPVLLADYWFPAAHIDYYIARPENLDLMAVGDLSAIHHYAWLNRWRAGLQPGGDAYFIAVSNYFEPPSKKLLSHFEQVLPPVQLPQYRGGVVVRTFLVYRLLNYRGGIPANGIL